MKAAFLAFLLCGPVLADFAAGQRAMKIGDDATAVREFLPLAKDGNTVAQLYLCVLYTDGAIPHDYREALRWCRSAAEQGQIDAQVHLGTIYERGGEGVQVDHKEAVKWYRLAAEQGNGEAQYFLAYMYEQGVGVLQDYVEAHMWLNLAGAANGVTGGIRAYSISLRDFVAAHMTPGQIAEAQRRAREWKPKVSR